MSPPRRSREPKHPLGCHDRALRLLAARSRSRRELQSRLLRAGFDAAEVEDELARLESVGLVDDEVFARQFAEHAQTARRAGRRGVASALLAKGVARDIVDRTLDDLGGDEERRARELARARAARLGGLEPAVAFRRLVSFLVRRGYDASIARAAAREALALEAGGG